MSAIALSIDIRNAAGVTSRLKVEGQNVLIGRTRDAGLALESNTISRRHAEILRDPFGRWWIRDLNSRNGTHVNGVRITESVVKPGDLIQLGEFLLTLSAADETKADAPPPQAAGVEASVSVVDGQVGRITSLKDFEIPRLSAAHLSTLSEFGQQLVAIDDAGARLSALCRLMVSAEFRGRSALVLRASKENLTEPPKPLCAVEATEKYKDWQPYVSRTVLRTVVARNEPVLAGNTAGSRGGGSGPNPTPPPTPDFAELSISSDVMAISAVAVPVRSEKTYMDLLYVVFPPECATSEWLALAALAVKQFQQAETTWVGKKLGEVHAAIERELAQAHVIQERLVPRSIRIPGLDIAIGFTPCKWVGGDYVDVVAGKNGQVLLVIADVCGKGLPAALVASSLHMMTHTAMRAGTPLLEIMQNLNVYLAETLADGTFVTALAAMLDPATGKLEVINAGHPAGIFVTPSGTVELTQSAANMPLGIDPNAVLQSETTTLEAGTFFVIFTDGLTELPLEGGNLLGEEELATQVTRLITESPNCSCLDVSGRLTALLDSLQFGMSQDDRTFMLARRV
ncbi:MAG TPA: SpoIIE family protein phosphatase [Phycisphaerae bacterium]|nr:SpoIIE family protein phosphatase [Phycisphaerae bacterium]